MIHIADLILRKETNGDFFDEEKSTKTFQYSHKPSWCPNSHSHDFGFVYTKFFSHRGQRNTSQKHKNIMFQEQHSSNDFQ